MWKRTCLLLLGLCLCHGTIAADRHPANVEDLLSLQEQLQASLEQAKEATVAVGSMGSGVIVSKDGYVLSAEHITQRPGQSLTLTLHDGQTVTAKTLGASRFADAGLLKITREDEWPSAPLAASGTTEVGDWCFAFGHPGGYEAKRGPVLRMGRVIAIRRNMLRSDCALIGGDSGGPLFNMDGEVIGIHSRVSEDIEGNYHAPVEAVHRHWDRLLAGEIVPRQSGHGGGFLGVAISSHDDGVLIDKLIEDSPAAKEDLLKAGDIITHVGHYHVASPEELALTITSLEPGEEVTIRYRRNQCEGAAKVKLGTHPQWRARR